MRVRVFRGEAMEHHHVAPRLFVWGHGRPMRAAIGFMPAAQEASDFVAAPVHGFGGEMLPPLAIDGDQRLAPVEARCFRSYPSTDSLTSSLVLLPLRLKR